MNNADKTVKVTSQLSIEWRGRQGKLENVSGISEGETAATEQK